ncbi:MAG: zinc ribbon domain-containing protein [Actinomycetota bacterium]
MVTCARCGTENADGNRFCQSCGSVLREAETAHAATLDEPGPIPEWVLPSHVAAPPKPGVKPPRGRPAKFIVLLIAWLGIFLAAPGWGVWTTSSWLREVGPRDYFHTLPTCEETAQSGGGDPSLCAQPDFKERYKKATDDVNDERRRVIVFSAIAYAALALATVILVIAAGLRVWWALGVVISPLNLVVWVWALWRISAYPVRYWAPRENALR